MKSKVGYIKGSYTVEAAFIVPLILGLLFTIMYMVFFWHDKVMLQSNLQNVLYLLNEQQISCKKEEYDTYLEEYLWILEITNMEVSENTMAFRGEIYAETEVTIPVVSVFLSELPKVHISETCSKVQPEQIKRLKENKKEKTDSKRSDDGTRTADGIEK